MKKKIDGTEWRDYRQLVRNIALRQDMIEATKSYVMGNISYTKKFDKNRWSKEYEQEVYDCIGVSKGDIK